MIYMNIVQHFFFISIIQQTYLHMWKVIGVCRDDDTIDKR